MIKAGQIWKFDGTKIVVTKHYTLTDRFDCIDKTGETDNWGKAFIEEYGEFVAEYPTWQEAVNSKEFKGE
jgi:hypothetical protein